MDMLLKLRTVVLFAIVSVILLMFSVSCGISELGSAEYGTTGVWVDKKPGPGGKPDVGGGNVPVLAESCYVTAMEYPTGYDWQADLQKGTVRCSLVVYINGTARMKLAVGDAYCISSDADMHRIVAGDIFTDYSTDTETIVKKNGTEIFRWTGREAIKGLEVVGSDVYTLSQPRSGKGFSLRKNGDKVFSKDNGYVYEHLEYDSDLGVCFSFCELIPAQSGTMERYYIVRGSDVSQVALRDDITNVWDVAVHKGKPCFVASIKGMEDLMLVDGDQLNILNLPDGASAFDSRLFISNGSVFVEAVLGIDCDFASILWKDGKELTASDLGMTVISFAESKGSYCCVMNSAVSDGGGYICKNGEMYEISKGYLSVGNKTSAFVNGILYVGLSPIGGGRPLLWQDGQVQEMTFNGFITSVQSVSAVP